MRRSHFEKARIVGLTLVLAVGFQAKPGRGAIKHNSEAAEGATISVEVTFQGLMAFVPIYNGDKIDHVWVLLVRADDPQRARPLADSTLHFGFVRLDAINLGAPLNAPILLSLASRQPFSPLPSSNTDSKDIVLAAPFIETTIQVLPGLLASVPNLRTVSVPGTGDNAKVVDHALDDDVSKLTPQQQKVLRADVVGRILLAHGSIDKKSYLDCSSSPGEFKYLDASGVEVGTGKSFTLIAQSAILKMSFPRARLPLVFTLKSFDGQTMSLQLSPAPGKDIIPLEILNMPLADILGVRQPNPTNPNRSEHFALYHFISKMKLPPAVFPEVDLQQCASGGAGKPYCTFTLMEPQ